MNRTVPTRALRMLSTADLINQHKVASRQVYGYYTSHHQDRISEIHSLMLTRALNGDKVAVDWVMVTRLPAS